MESRNAKIRRFVSFKYLLIADFNLMLGLKPNDIHQKSQEAFESFLCQSRCKVGSIHI
jgi:hypothetical protein